jgi:hypothetical protein
VIFTENLNMHHTATSLQCAHNHIPENHRVCDQQQHGYHSPSYLPDLAPVISLCFPNWKWNRRDDVLKVSDIQRWYSISLRKMTSTVLLKRGKIMGSLYTFPRWLLWRRWQPKLSKLSQHVFFDLVWKLSNIPHIYHSSMKLPVPKLQRQMMGWLANNKLRRMWGKKGCWTIWGTITASAYWDWRKP